MDWALIATGAFALANGMIAGAFLIFSDFIMKSLAAAQPAAGIQAMQLINRKIFRTIFMVLLIGMAVLSPIIAGHAIIALSGPAATWLILGAALYIFGTFGITAIFNVPRNKRLDALDHASAESAAYWQVYLREWTFWNSVRTAACALSAASYLIALVSIG